MSRSHRWRAAVLLSIVLSACHSHPSYQQQQPAKKPEPAQAAVANMQMAIEYMRLNNLAQARDRIERALGEAPENAQVEETAGLVYERLNEMAKAKRAFQTAARIGKDQPDIQNSYAGFLCRTGRTKEGERLFIEVAKNPVYRTPEVALLNAGTCVGEAGDVLDAQRYFDRALAVRPNMPEALLQLGNLAFGRGDFSQALDYVQRYLALNQPTPEVLMLGLKAQRRLGDNAAAAAFGRRVQTEFPDSEQAQALRSGIER